MKKFLIAAFLFVSSIPALAVPHTVPGERIVVDVTMERCNGFKVRVNDADDVIIWMDWATKKLSNEELYDRLMQVERPAPDLTPEKVLSIAKQVVARCEKATSGG